MIPVEHLFHAPSGEGDTLARPLDHLKACHRRIEMRLAALERAAAHLDSAPEAAREAAASCFRFFDTNGVLHTQDEEESLFPRLRSRLSREELDFVEKLEREHQQAEDYYRQLKPAIAAGDAPRSRELAGKLCEIYRSHIAAEDTTLIAVAARALSEAELAEISREMKRRRGFAGER